MVQHDQIRVERLAVVYLFLFMIFAAMTFLNGAGASILPQFSREVGVVLTPDTFAVLCFGGAALAPLLLASRFRKLPAIWKRQLYVLCASPIILFSVPVGWVVYRTGGSGFAAVAYIAIFFSFVVIARATYRE